MTNPTYTLDPAHIATFDKMRNRIVFYARSAAGDPSPKRSSADLRLAAKWATEFDRKYAVLEAAGYDMSGISR